MKSMLRLGLRSGEKIYINGAVIKVDRKVRLELLNDVTFLLESHVMPPEEATSSLRRLYFLVQGILMDPSMKGQLHSALGASIELIVCEGIDTDGAGQLRSVAYDLDAGNYFKALKEIRSLINRCEVTRQEANIERLVELS